MKGVNYFNIQGHDLELNNLLPCICVKRNAHVRDNAFQSGFRNIWSVNARDK
jgi:hypothetical protein